MTVLDASAVLAFLQGEPGADLVREHLHGSLIGSANLAEVLARLDGPVERSLAEAILVGSGVRTEAVSAGDARGSAAIKDSSPGLSLGDRLCLALAARRNDMVLTADRAWGQGDRILQIR
jgi:PIN domain nuclease of toxin-antitoxin system